MAVRQIKWSSLLHYAELEFVPEPPQKLEVTDELLQSLSWLTGATRQDRRLLRCTEQGALLIANAWAGLNSVETDELYIRNNTPDTHTPTVEHKAILLAASTKLAKASFVRKSGGAAEVFYVPANSYFFYPYSVYTVTLEPVPLATGGTSYVGSVCLM